MKGNILLIGNASKAIKSREIGSNLGVYGSDSSRPSDLEYLAKSQVSKRLKLFQIKNIYIKLTSITLNSQTLNQEEVSHGSKKSGKDLA
jgi:hypothetical protein